MNTGKVENVLKSLCLHETESLQTDSLRSLSSLLVSILFLTKSAEEIASKDSTLGDIHLAIHAKTVVRSNGSNVQSLHTLWGPELSPSLQPGRAVPVNENQSREVRAVVPAESSGKASVQLHGDRAGPENDRRELNSSQRMMRRESNIETENVAPSSVSPSVKAPTCDLPVSVVKLAQSLLLDSVGWTTHPFTRKTTGVYQSLTVGFLQKIIRGVMKDEKARLGVSPATVLKYESLIPSEYRTQRTGTSLEEVDSSFVVDVGLPDVDIALGVECSTRNRKRLRLEMQKPDRLKKVEQIAVIMFWLHAYGLGGAYAMFLRKLAREGLTGGRCSPKTCGGPARCADKPKPLNNFYMEIGGKRKMVGRGEVDPFSSYLLGQEVRDSDIVVRFNSYSGPPLHKFESGNEDAGAVERAVENLAEHQICPCVLPKRDISRATLIGELQEKVGTALVVGFPRFEKDKTNRRYKEVDQMDILNAIIVTDVKFEEDALYHLYPFREWYGMRSAKNRLREMHFKDAKVPKKLSEISSKCVALLWHKERIHIGDV